MNPWPQCAVCKRPVYRMTQHRDDAYMQVVFIAECHGEFEEVRLSDHDMQLDWAISIGYAFAAARIQEQRLIDARPTAR